MVAAQPRQHVVSICRYRLAMPAFSLQGTLVVISLAIVAVLAITATQQRTGDAHQYVAMTQLLAERKPPWLDPNDQETLAAWMRSRASDSGFATGALAIRQPALIHDGVQELSHFWAFPLVVSPLWALFASAHLDPLTAFPIVNSLLLGTAIIAVYQTFGFAAALLGLASPLLWFVARAQVEVFTVSLLLLAMCSARGGRWAWGSLLIALAATQNLPISMGVPLFWCAGIGHWLAAQDGNIGRQALISKINVKAVAIATLAIGVALLHPAYYIWRLGVFTPQQLNGGISGAIPDMTRLLAPIADPDIGFAWWMPVQSALALLGLCWLVRDLRQGKRRDTHLMSTIFVSGVMALWFLVVFAQTTNVNSGGTVHVSRYALWLLPLCLPAAAIAIDRLALRSGMALPAFLILLLLLNVAYFKPDQQERYVEHSPQATWLLSNAPWLYWPLPELFVERTLHIDGGLLTSAGDPACRILLVVNAPPASCPLSEQEFRLIAQQRASGETYTWLRRSNFPHFSEVIRGFPSRNSAQ